MTIIICCRRTTNIDVTYLFDNINLLLETASVWCSLAWRGNLNMK